MRSCALGGVLVHARGDAVGREDDHLALGHLGLLVDEDRAALRQLLDDVLVVDDLLAHVDRRAVQVERVLDRLHGTIDARAVAARRRQQDPLGPRARCRGGGGHVQHRVPGRPQGRASARVAAYAQGHLDRLTSIDASFLTNESSDSHMHVGAVLIFEGPPPDYDDFLEHVREPPAPGAALPPEARLPAGRRPGGRSGSTTRTSTSPTTCATRRCPRRAPRSSCGTSPGASSPRRSTARSRSGRCGWSRGWRRTASRSINKTHHALVDGVVRRRHRDRALRREAGARADRGRRRAGSRAPPPRPPSSPRTGIRGARRDARSSSRAGPCAPPPIR